MARKKTRANVTSGRQMISTETEERHHELLLNNELVDGNEAIANIIRSNAELVNHNRGHLLIKKGDEDDTVYFILKGSVSVRNKVRHLADKEAPEVVGEMAAKSVGSRRTADVTVSSDEAQFLALSGVSFRRLMTEHPKFKENLDLLMEKMAREKIAQLGETPTRTGISWNAISGLFALMCALTIGILMWNEEFGWKLSSVISIISGTAVGLVCLLLNPAFIYRNTFRLSAMLLIGLVAYGSISFVGSFATKGESLPFLLDLRWEGDGDTKIFGVSAIALLVLCVISGWLDVKSTNQS